jgi:hypothetical protein
MPFVFISYELYFKAVCSEGLQRISEAEDPFVCKAYVILMHGEFVF